MKKVLIIGSGIAGLSSAIECAKRNMEVTLVSPYSSERAQSVLAAGGINAVIDDSNGDSIESHIEDTLKGGCNIAGREAVTGLCTEAPNVIRKLEKWGTVFSVDEKDEIKRRAFGGQSHIRTCFCGASTGKQIVTALVMEARRYEIKGLINRRLKLYFYSALIKNGKCYGALFYNNDSDRIEMIRADFVVFATGGQNALFGKTTGSTLCDGYAHGKLFTQGVNLKNLEFIQYHPTTLETSQKMLLVSEAVRGEGGRLYYLDGDKRVYFMEEMYGENGNLMTRDVVSRCMYNTGKDIFLDITFLGEEQIKKRLPEVYDLCMKYRGIDITKESIPVTPSVNFFMGGIAVHNNHESNIKRLYAVGECASIYHGANRLGGNSLLAAMYGGRVAAESIAKSETEDSSKEDFAKELSDANAGIDELKNTIGNSSVMSIRNSLANIMKTNLGIVRDGDRLYKGINDIENAISSSAAVRCDNRNHIYPIYSLQEILILAKATLVCALSRKESRGAHYRSDYTDTSDEYFSATIISYDNGKYNTHLDLENEYES